MDVWIMCLVPQHFLPNVDATMVPQSGQTCIIALLHQGEVMTHIDLLPTVSELMAMDHPVPLRRILEDSTDMGGQDHQGGGLLLKDLRECLQAHQDRVHPLDQWVEVLRDQCRLLDQCSLLESLLLRQSDLHRRGGCRHPRGRRMLPMALLFNLGYGTLQHGRG